MEPNQRGTKFLRAGIDTCANVNILPISVYKVIYKDPDCVMLAPSNKTGITTYTNEKINVLGFCDMFVVHPKCLQKITFQVVHHEGSVIVSCATNLELGLIQLHSVFNKMNPDCGRLLYSEADHPNKYRYQNIKSSSSMSDNASAIAVQSNVAPDVRATEVIQCVIQMGQEKSKLMPFLAQEVTVLQDRKCQKMKRVHMWPQETKSYKMQSRKPAIKCKKEHQKDQSVVLPHNPATMVKKPGQTTQPKVLKNKNYSNDNKSSSPVRKQEDDKNCQFRGINEKSPKRTVCSDPKCQSAVKTVCSDKNCQETNMQPVKAVPKGYRRLCKDKTCQSTRFYKMISDPQKRQKYSTIGQVNQEGTSLDVTSKRS